MKQIDVCLDRHFTGQLPLKAKWQARWHKDHSHMLILFHYQHVVLIYDTIAKKVEYEWWEVPTDKRGLDAAKEYLAKM
jgi:hypothetical protein